MTATDEIKTLQEKIASMQAELDAKTQALASKDQELEHYHSEHQGWLVWTPQPDFDGNLYGIQFVNGHAFIPEGAPFEAFAVAPMSPNQLNRYLDMQFPKPPYTDEQRAEQEKGIREREQISSAQRLVDALREFGYSVEYFSADRLPDLESKRRELTLAAKKLQESQSVTQSQLGLLRPQYMGEGRR